MVDSNSIRSTLGGAQILFELGALNQTASRLAQTYLSLGGDQSLSWPDGTSPAVVADELREKVGVMIDRDIHEATRAIRSKESKYDCLSAYTYYISSDKYSFPAVLVEPNHGFLLELKHFKKIKRKKKLYGLLQMIVKSFCDSGLAVSEDYLFENQYEFYLDELSAEDPAEAKKLHESLNRTKAFIHGDSKDHRKKQSLDESYKVIKPQLSKRQRTWIENAIATIQYFAKLWRQWRKSSAQGDLWNIVSDDDQFESLRMRPPFHSYFQILWDSNSHIFSIVSDDMNSMINEYGQPCQIMAIRTQKDLELACGFITHIAKLQQLFAEFEEVFLGKCRARKRTV